MTTPTATQAQLDAFLDTQAAAFVSAFRSCFGEGPNDQKLSVCEKHDMRHYFREIPLVLTIQEPTPAFVVIAYTPAPWMDAPPYPGAAPTQPAYGGTIWQEIPLLSDSRQEALETAMSLAREHFKAHIVIRRGEAPNAEVARFAPLETAA